MSETAVCNSTCLIGLDRIGKTDILQQSFDIVFIPPAVFREIGYSKEWLIVRPIINISMVNILAAQIGPGESEAIALAAELGETSIILDDKKARKIAQLIIPRVIGNAGILLRAKNQGIIRKIKPILDALNEVDFRIGNSLYKHALELAQEGL